MFNMFKRKIKRSARIERKTKETQISCSLNIDGKGETQLDTGIGFLNHMLELFAFHGLFDLKLKAKGDIKKVDLHHTNEDIGIVLGQAFKKALGDMRGIKRFGYASAPMEDVKADVTVDISGRGHFGGISRNFSLHQQAEGKESYALENVDHFFESFAKQSGINLLIKIEYYPSTSAYPPIDVHTTLEPVFKALGKALDQATQIDPRRKGVPSTKRVID